MVDEMKIEDGSGLQTLLSLSVEEGEPHVPDVITPAWVKSVVKHIKALADDGDNGGAHRLEDWLHRVVLHRIASGHADNVHECALEAVQTLHLTFTRWYE